MNTIWVTLLKGINRENVAMEELESALRESGLQDIRSVLDSGNLVFSSTQPRDELEETVRDVLKARFGVATRPVILKASQFQAVLEENPLGEKCTQAPDNVHVLFLRKPALRPDFQQMERFKDSAEAWFLLDDALYLTTPGEFRKSQLAVRLERLLGVATAPRQWSEVLEIQQLVDSVE